MTTLTQQWQDAARDQGVPLSTYLSSVLAEAPTHLSDIAALLSLDALHPAQVSTNWRFDVLSLPEALAHGVLPVEVLDQVYIVLSDPFSLAVRNWVQMNPALTHAHPAMTLPGVVAEQLKLAETSARATPFEGDGGGLGQGRLADAVPEISLSTIARDDNPVVKLVNSMLFDALQNRASDIHVESTPEGLVIKYRIDGVLQEMGQAAGLDTAEQALSRLKVLSALDIGERRVPQDGRFKVHMQGRDIDFRVSIMPSIHGEDAVLRILDKNQRGKTLTLETLGLDKSAIDLIRALASEPYGMMLVTGPTGSGKSTTMYAALSETNTGEKKIITIEDPVEYELTGVLQIPVNDKKGLTFARGLRSILRHDPDTILVGEIRDGDTAGIAVQAALTGHMVMSSVHANSSFSVLERFLYMGVEPASFVEALNGVVAQRLLRRVCDQCSSPAVPDASLAHAAGLSDAQMATWTYRVGKGCDACRGTGYKGRLALAEVLRVTDSIKDALLSRASSATLRKTAKESGHIFMREIGLHNAAMGLTTLQELHRVITLY